MEASALFEKVRQSGDDKDEPTLPGWSELDAAKQARIAPVLERLALIRSLDENQATPNKNMGDTGRITALDINLLITCLEMLAGEPEGELTAPPAKAPADDATPDTAESVATEPESSNGSSMDIAGGEPAADPAAAARLQKDVSADLLLEVREAEREGVAAGPAANKPAPPSVVQPEPTETRVNPLRHLFTEILDKETREWIAVRCWVYVDDPVEEWDALHLVKLGFNEASSVGHRRLSDARKRWDVLTQKQRLEEVADVCQSLRQEYTKGHVFRPSECTVDPVPAMLRDAGAAATAGHVSYMSDSAYAAMEQSGDYHMVAQENIRAQLKNGELYVRNSTISSAENPAWMEPFLKLATTRSGQGETIIQDRLKRGLVVPEKKLVNHLEDWLMNALRSIAA